MDTNKEYTYEELKAKALNTMHYTMMRYAECDTALISMQYIACIKEVVKCIEDLEMANLLGLAPRSK